MTSEYVAVSEVNAATAATVIAGEWAAEIKGVVATRGNGTVMIKTVITVSSGGTIAGIGRVASAATSASKVRIATTTIRAKHP